MHISASPPAPLGHLMSQREDLVYLVHQLQFRSSSPDGASLFSVLAQIRECWVHPTVGRREVHQPSWGAEGAIEGEVVVGAAEALWIESGAAAPVVSWA
jgi:hypothetical protein